MNELESLEHAIRQWQPRPPAPRLARRLFGRTEPRSAAPSLRRAEFWSWLTPVAACALTLLVGVGSAGHRANSLGGKSGSLALAGLSFSASSSNFMDSIQLTDRDENVQWNAYPVLSSNAQISRSTNADVERAAAATHLNRSF